MTAPLQSFSPALTVFLLCSQTQRQKKAGIQCSALKGTEEERQGESDTGDRIIGGISSDFNLKGNKLKCSTY